jgi:undecaprenyl diphosphate synthase
MSELETLPSNLTVGLLPDGNRRYAARNSISYAESYSVAGDVLDNIIDYLFHKDLCANIVVYGLGESNILRRNSDDILTVLNSIINKCKIWNETGKFCNMNVSVKPIVGKIVYKYFNDSPLYDILNSLEIGTRNGRKNLFILLGYSGRSDIINSLQRTVINDYSKLIAHMSVPVEIDLVLRTAGEHRLSDFCLFQCAMSEFIIFDKLFPELTKDDIKSAIINFHRRRRLKGA